MISLVLGFHLNGGKFSPLKFREKGGKNQTGFDFLDVKMCTLDKLPHVRCSNKTDQSPFKRKKTMPCHEVKEMDKTLLMEVLSRFFASPKYGAQI